MSLCAIALIFTEACHKRTAPAPAAQQAVVQPAKAQPHVINIVKVDEKEGVAPAPLTEEQIHERNLDQLNFNYIAALNSFKVTLSIQDAIEATKAQIALDNETLRHLLVNEELEAKKAKEEAEAQKPAKTISETVTAWATLAGK